MNFHQSQTKRTGLSAGVRLTLLMLAQVLLVVAVITDPRHHSWPAMWIASLDCSSTSDESMHNYMQTVALY